MEKHYLRGLVSGLRLSLSPGIRCNARLIGSTFVLALSLVPMSLFAKGEVTIINTSLEPAATQLTYEKNGVTYHWGQGNNLKVEGFVYKGNTYDYSTDVSRVVIRRVDNKNSSGAPCNLFAEIVGEQTTVGPYNFAPSYPDDGTGTGNCDMGKVMGSRLLNLGALDVFANAGTAFPHSFSNIERVDFIFDHGIIAPRDETLLDETGHAVTEKHGNNPVNIAAITRIDASGNPTAYGPLVFVHPNSRWAQPEETAGDGEIQYGMTNISITSDFLTNERHAPQGYVEYRRGLREPLGMAFVSLQDLGITAGQKYYGFSFFGADVDPDTHAHILTDPSTFPQDTQTNTGALRSGDADLFGGTAGFFELGDIQGISGSVFRDDDNDGIRGDSEIGIPRVSVTLIDDTNGNGSYDVNIDRPLGETAGTDDSGGYNFPGLLDSSYFVLVDENDEDLPGGYTVGAVVNPAAATLTGTDVIRDFPFSPPPSEAGVPVANSDTATTVQNSPVEVDVLTNDSDPDGGTLTLSITTPPAHGTAIITADNTIVYTPDTDYVGSDSFTYQATNSSGNSDTAVVAITINPAAVLDDGDGVLADGGAIIETGLIGTGTGSFDWLLLLLSGMTVWYRRNL